MQNLILMHKNIPVLNFSYDEEVSKIEKINEIINQPHIPIGISFKDGILNRGELNKWWQDRAIPASREGLANALEQLGIDSRVQLLEKGYGLSLSDHYWVCPENQNLNWNNVNFFDNSFSSDVGNALFGEVYQSSASVEMSSLVAPENSSDGMLKKKWFINEDSTRYLIKEGSGVYKQEPLNEVFASIILDKLKIPHVDYFLFSPNDKNGPHYSICPNFITKNTELISAWDIYNSQKKLNHCSHYQHFVKCAENLGVPDVRQFLDKMITFDALIANEDRHFRNFGIIRDADTLKCIGMAPIFDNGNSLWYQTHESHIDAYNPPPSKPFKTSHDEQLKYVNSFDWLDLSKLKDIDEVFTAYYSQQSSLMSDERTSKLTEAFKTRIDLIQEFIYERNSEINNNVPPVGDDR